MPTEPLKKLSDLPPLPDPAAVRAALAEIDAARTAYERNQSYDRYGNWRDTLIDNWIEVVIAARAWLAEQEASE